MPKESLQKKVGRVRPPRVHITYDVEIGDAIEKRDLPFVVGVLADLSGMPEKAKILVVANRTALCDELREAMRERAEEGPAEFVLLVPATAHGASRAMDPYTEMGEARRLAERSLALHRELEDRQGTADALNVLGLVLRGEGSPAEARASAVANWVLL